jgi:transcriptional regulator with XRE-family HTH domain
MNIGQNIKNLRKEKGLQQKEIAAELGLDQSNYNKIENNKREVSIEVLTKLSKIFGVTVDQIINPSEDIPKAVTIEDKSFAEQVRLIQQLDEADRVCIFKMIDTMLTKKKFQDFFQQQLATK